MANYIPSNRHLLIKVQSNADIALRDLSCHQLCYWMKFRNLIVRKLRKPSAAIYVAALVIIRSLQLLNKLHKTIRYDSAVNDGFLHAKISKGGRRETLENQ